MGARIWMYFIVFLAILVSLNKGDNSSAPKANPKVVVEGNNNAVNLCHDKEIKTALVQIQKKLETLERKMSILANPGKFDFTVHISDIYTAVHTSTAYMQLCFISRGVLFLSMILFESLDPRCSGEQTTLISSG